MPLNRSKSGNFYAADIAPGAGATYSTASDAVDVGGYQRMGIQLVAKGANASSAGAATFKFATSVDGTNYEDANNTTDYSVNVSGTTERRLSVNLDVQFIKFIKILQVVNGDGTYALTLANVNYYLEEYL